jgi:DNA-binding NarL/FixJ family response regulator
VLSEHTVHRHVTNILRKLSVTAPGDHRTPDVTLIRER